MGCTANINTIPSKQNLRTVITFSSGRTDPNFIAFHHNNFFAYMFKSLHHFDSTSATWVDSTNASITLYTYGLVHKYAQDSLSLSGSSLQEFDSNFVHALILTGDTSHGNRTSLTCLNYYLNDTLLGLTTREKNYIVAAYNMINNSTSTQGCVDSLKSLFAKLKLESWTGSQEGNWPATYILVTMNSANLWGTFYDSTIAKTPGKPSRPQRGDPSKMKGAIIDDGLGLLEASSQLLSQDDPAYGLDLLGGALASSGVGAIPGLNWLDMGTGGAISGPLGDGIGAFLNWGVGVGINGWNGFWGSIVPPPSSWINFP